MAQPFNFTGRDEFSHKEFELKLNKKSPRLSIFFKQHLAQIKKYSGCAVKITASRTTKSQQIDLGMINKLVPSCTVDFPDFADGDGVHFKVVVVEPGTKLIRAKIERLSLEDESKPKRTTKMRGILPVSKAKNDDGLKGRFWKVEYTSENPILLVTPKYSSTAAVNSPEFQALAWPAILKEVLTHAFIVKCHNFPTWAKDWMTLATIILGVSEGAPKEEPKDKDLEVYLETTEKWIDAVSAEFASKRGLSEITSEFKKGGAK